MSGDDIVERLRHETPRNIGSLRMDAADEIVRLRAERDASQLIISDLTAQLERQRAAILLLGLADIERLAADNKRLRAEREDIDLLHVPCTDDDLTFCHECVGGWPCRTHLRLHPEEARRG